MEYMYGALLIHSAGKEINEASIKKVIEAAGTQPDESKVKALVAALDGVNIDEELKKASTPVAVASVAPQGEAKKEETKKEPEENVEQKAAEAAAGLSALFG